MRSFLNLIFMIVLMGLASLRSDAGIWVKQTESGGPKGDTITIADSLIQSVSFACDYDDKDQLIVINSPKEFGSIFGNKCVLPDIDLKKYTMLFFVTTSSGCSVDYYRKIKIVGDKAFYIVTKAEEGGCQPQRIDRICVIVPKIDEGKEIELKIIKSKR